MSLLTQSCKGSLLWAAFVLLASCETRQPVQQSPVIPANVQRVDALDSATLASPASSVAQAEQLELLVVGDSIGPRPLKTSQVGTAQLRSELAEDYTKADTIAGRFMVIKTISDSLRLLFRTSRHDTVWTELNGLLDQYEHGDQQFDIQVQQANLDGNGSPEVLIHFYSAIYGSGGGVTYGSDYVLDISHSSPQLLLQASSRIMLEASPAYAAMHGDTMEADEVEVGYERTIKLQGREVRVGSIKAKGRDPESSGRLTQLPAGRYRYQNGRMFRIKD